MAKKRLTRKQLLKEPDEFISLTGRTIQWSRDHVKQLVMGAVAVLVLIAAASAYSFYNQSQAKSAAALFGEGLSKAQAQGQDQASGEPALAAAEPDIRKLVNDYGGQPAGRLGRILLGHIYLSKKAPQEAFTYYKKALDDFDNDPSLTNVILNGLSASSELKGEHAAAAEYSEKIVAGTSSVLKDVALFRLGRLYRTAGDVEKSNKAYEQLSTDFPESIYAAIAKERANV